MRRIILLATTIALSLTAYAQSGNGTERKDTARVQPIESARLQGPREATETEKAYARQLAEEREQQEQIDRNLPLVDTNAQTLTANDACYPYWNYGWGWDTWRLHKGLNVNVGASVFANFGDGWGHGAGFAQDVSLMYVSNLSKKATLAVGGYLNNTIYSGDNYTTAGINVLFGYRFDEHWSAYAFVQKAFVSDNYSRLYYDGYGPWGYAGYGMGFGGWGYGPMAFGYGANPTRYMDRIGGGVTYQWGKDNQNSLNIQVEFDHVPSQHDGFYNNRRYDYPVR
ncbi:hypothetical protein [Prevotella dentasini]|uniref:hypothetical protein n=1 Tax=Prevotella dentasini TaxID=589537 RepID=UPI0004697BD6|nr:hypothetical protein [Prevotella dentasini]